MKYVLAPNNVFQRFILPGEVVQFSDRCKTTAKRLDTAEAAEYGVSKLKLVSPPAYDPLTQGRNELPPLLVAGDWVQQWEVVELDAAGKAESAERAREAAKQIRAAKVAAITVTTAAGNTFDGDETSQTRMARAIIALNTLPQSPLPSLPWVLADNSVISATAAELTEALMLAGAAQSAMWVL